MCPLAGICPNPRRNVDQALRLWHALADSGLSHHKPFENTSRYPLLTVSPPSGQPLPSRRQVRSPTSGRFDETVRPITASSRASSIVFPQSLILSTMCTSVHMFFLQSAGTDALSSIHPPPPPSAHCVCDCLCCAIHIFRLNGSVSDGDWPAR